MVVASILAPLGLSEEIVPGVLELVEFQYAKDLSPWGEAATPQIQYKPRRRCWPTAFSCSGQDQTDYLWNHTVTQADGQRVFPTYDMSTISM